MENNNINIHNQEEEIIYNYPQKDYYYTTTGKRVGDFMLGFFGYIIINLILVFVFLPLLAGFYWGYSFFPIVINALLLVLFFKIGRRFIAIGIISVILISILIFGSCVLTLSQYRFG